MPNKNQKNEREERRAYTSGVEFRVAGADQEGTLGTLVGMAAVYNKDSVDLGWFIERVSPGAFNRTLDSDADVFALADHDPARRLARRSSESLRLVDTADGLSVEIDIPDTTTGRDIAEEVRSGLVSGMSFAFRCFKDSWEDRSEQGLSTLRVLEDVELFEVSIVGLPAYPDTSIAKRSSEAARNVGTPSALNEGHIAKANMRLRVAAL